LFLYGLVAAVEEAVMRLDCAVQRIRGYKRGNPSAMKRAQALTRAPA